MVECEGLAFVTLPKIEKWPNKLRDVSKGCDTADPDVSRSIHDWAHIEDFYIAEDWFGMNDLDLQLPTNHFELANSFSLHPFFLVPLSFFMSVFITLLYIFHADLQVLYHGPRA